MGLRKSKLEFRIHISRLLVLQTWKLLTQWVSKWIEWWVCEWECLCHFRVIIGTQSYGPVTIITFLSPFFNYVTTPPSSPLQVRPCHEEDGNAIYSASFPSSGTYYVHIPILYPHKSRRRRLRLSHLVYCPDRIYAKIGGAATPVSSAPATSVKTRTCARELS